jgi:NADH:ubiquinone oxidoreductase subunit K
MNGSRKWPKLFGGPPKKLLDEDERLDAPIRGPLFPRPVVVGLLVVFCVSLMLTADWFGLLLLNDRVSDRIGPLNTVRVMAVLMTGIAVPSALLMLHYRRLYSYVSEHNVFFAITFSLSFMLGLPCALVAVFG